MKSNLSKSFGALVAGALLLAGGVAHATTIGSGTEYATASANSQPTAITVDILGLVWYAEDATNAIVVASSKLGIQVEYTIPTASVGVGGLVQGSDFSIWFTETLTGNIGSVDLFGNFHEYPAVNPLNSQLGNIASGSDGNLWFPDLGQGNIDTMDTSGNLLNSYAVPTIGSAPLAITAGPDGNLWFSESQCANADGTCNIGKITTAGVITEYKIGSFVVNRLAAGADGNIWFTDSVNGAVGVFKIKTSTATEYAITGTTNGPNPQEITAAADGNLWFVDFGNDQVDRVTTKGVITKYALPSTNTAAASIARASTLFESAEPYVYVTETNLNKVTRVYVSDVDPKHGEN